MTSDSSALQTKTRQILQSVTASGKKVALVLDGDVASTVLAHVAVSEKVPLAAVVHVDNGFDFPQSKAIVDALAASLNQKLIVERVSLDATGSCCDGNKTKALAAWAVKNGVEVFLLPSVFASKSTDYRQLDESADASVSGGAYSFDRVYPLSAWSEADLFAYCRDQNLSINPLYLSRNGKRFSRIRCQACSKPVDSTADALDKVVMEVSAASTSGISSATAAPKSDAVMDRLRALGYL